MEHSPPANTEAESPAPAETAIPASVVGIEPPAPTELATLDVPVPPTDVAVAQDDIAAADTMPPALELPAAVSETAEELDLPIPEIVEANEAPVPEVPNPAAPNLAVIGETAEAVDPPAPPATPAPLASAERMMDQSEEWARFFPCP